jgi:hypothetical protein
MTCDWCGHVHDRTALCAKRPTWGRRGFLALMGTGLAPMIRGGNIARFQLLTRLGVLATLERDIPVGAGTYRFNEVLWTGPTPDDVVRASVDIVAPTFGLLQRCTSPLSAPVGIRYPDDTISIEWACHVRL